MEANKERQKVVKMTGSEKQIKWAEEILEREYARIEKYESDFVSERVIDDFIFRNPVQEIEELEDSLAEEREQLINEYGMAAFKKNAPKNDEVIAYLNKKEESKKTIVELKKKAYKEYLDSFENASDVINALR